MLLLFVLPGASVPAELSEQGGALVEHLERSCCVRRHLGCRRPILEINGIAALFLAPHTRALLLLVLARVLAECQRHRRTVPLALCRPARSRREGGVQELVYVKRLVGRPPCGDRIHNGGVIDAIDFYLTNQDGDNIDMMGSDWLATVRLAWNRPSAPPLGSFGAEAESAYGLRDVIYAAQQQNGA